MAGHSKWANIKHRKGAADARRGQVFTKLAKEIMISAKLGGSDENSNPRLRTAILKARAANMPKDNIERAVKKGAGELEGVNYEEAVYEGYGPGGIAIMIETMTDKRTRTIPELKNIFTKAGTSMAESGSVSYLFDHKGMLLVKANSATEDQLLEAVLETGGEDMEQDEPGVFVIYTTREDFHAVSDKLIPILEAKGCEILESGLKFVPQTTMELDAEKTTAVLKLLDQLESHDDVQNVYSNLELTDEVMAGSLSDS
ncbi:MAG: YebC/PmpR family DNA-binding transcriptional regulator [Leptospiraceae bacterium]|nr:YebC/PmpR family DNA-binding transcriptional regulator [Leptospiraceae bacterium]MCB1201321.1 YebC/PmpR family DNA-binding transcriptional regulator [Leptospiraceae bacterium]